MSPQIGFWLRTLAELRGHLLRSTKVQNPPSQVSLSPSFLRSLVCLRAFSEKPSIISQSHRKLTPSNIFSQQRSVKRGLLRWVGGTSKLVSTSSLGGLDTVQLAGCLEAQPARAASLRRLELLHCESTACQSIPLQSTVSHCQYP